MRVSFPQATVYQSCHTSESAPVELQTGDGRLVFLAFTDWDQAAAFCRRNGDEGLGLDPIRLDRDAEQFKEAFRPYFSTLGGENRFFAINPHTLRDQQVTVAVAKDVLAAADGQLEVKTRHLEWLAGAPTAHRGAPGDTIELDFYDLLDKRRRRVGTVAFAVLPLEQRTDFSCFPEYLIIFDEAKWIAGELKRGGPPAGCVTFSGRPASRKIPAVKGRKREITGAEHRASLILAG